MVPVHRNEIYFIHSFFSFPSVASICFDIHTDRHTDRHTHRQTYTQTVTETERQTDKQTNRKKHVTLLVLFLGYNVTFTNFKSLYIIIQKAQQKLQLHINYSQNMKMTLYKTNKALYT